jgi:hypothetical protein
LTGVVSLSYDLAGRPRMSWKDADDDLGEWENPDDPEGDDDETVTCPYCLRPVYEDAERCPGCGQYLSRQDRPARHPWWLLLGVLVGLVVVIRWVTFGRWP